MATVKKIDNKSAFLKELAAGAAKWRGIATKLDSKGAEEVNEYADAYEYILHSFTAPKKAAVKQ